MYELVYFIDALGTAVAEGPRLKHAPAHRPPHRP